MPKLTYIRINTSDHLPLIEAEYTFITLSGTYEDMHYSSAVKDWFKRTYVAWLEPNVEEESILSEEELKHLDWIYARLRGIHYENKNSDYMIKFKNIIDKLSK